MSATIELYGWVTTNPKKVAITLEECGLPYVLRPINIEKKEQLAPAYRTLNPFGKIPTMVDPEGPDGAPVTLTESSAILLYLAEKTGKLLPTEARVRIETLRWLFFQTANTGPFLYMDFLHRHLRSGTEAEVLDFFGVEAGRLLAELDRRLGDSRYFGGPDYSIADIAHIPHVSRHMDRNGLAGTYPNLDGWLERVMARPAVQKGMAIFS